MFYTKAFRGKLVHFIAFSSLIIPHTVLTKSFGTCIRANLVERLKSAFAAATSIEGVCENGGAKIGLEETGMS